MIYLALSILISSLLFVIFKLFDRFQVNTSHAIVVNYFVAHICGMLAYSGNLKHIEIPSQGWFGGAVFLGLLFILVFNIMALTSQRNGLSVASVAGKMSVVVPVAFAVVVYKERLGSIKIMGIVLALIAVYLTSMKNKRGVSIQRKTLWLPFLLFFGSGVIDTAIKYFETRYVAEGDVPIFSATIFAFAACMGMLFILKEVIRKRFHFEWKSMLGGIVLGVPNYFSIYYLLKALQAEGLESSTLFTINNVAIVMLTTLFGLFFFEERLLKKNWLGIGIAVVAIILVSYR